MIDAYGEWFDEWVNKLSHPNTMLYAARWDKGARTHEYAIGIQPGGGESATAHRLGIYADNGGIST